MITPMSMTWNTSNGDLDHRDVSDESLRIPCAEVAPRSLLHPMGGTCIPVAIAPYLAYVSVT